MIRNCVYVNSTLRHVDIVKAMRMEIQIDNQEEANRRRLIASSNFTQLRSILSILIISLMHHRVVCTRDGSSKAAYLRVINIFITNFTCFYHKHRNSPFLIVLSEHVTITKFWQLLISLTICSSLINCVNWIQLGEFLKFFFTIFVF
jgi:hypothetical protein